MVDADVVHKRKWHILQILGKGVDLLIQKTNSRANRRLTKCSSVRYKYKARRQDLVNGPVFLTFFGAYRGTAIIGIGARHLMKRSPPWLSQLVNQQLFSKLPCDLYRL